MHTHKANTTTQKHGTLHNAQYAIHNIHYNKTQGIRNQTKHKQPSKQTNKANKQANSKRKHRVTKQQGHEQPSNKQQATKQQSEANTLSIQQNPNNQSKRPKAASSSSSPARHSPEARLQMTPQESTYRKQTQTQKECITWCTIHGSTHPESALRQPSQDGRTDTGPTPRWQTEAILTVR